MTMLPNVRLNSEDEQYRIYLENNFDYQSPKLHLDHEKGRNEYLIGDLMLSHFGDHFYLAIKSSRRKTMIASAKVLDNGSIGIYLNQCFANMRNKAVLIEDLRARVRYHLYC